MPADQFLFGPFAYDCRRNEATQAGVPVAVGHKGLAILRALLLAGGRTVTKSELMDAAWPGTVVEESNLSVQIAALRKTVFDPADGVEWIVTVPRVGYRFAPGVTVGERDQSPIAASATTSFERKASIAVVSFENLSGDAREDFFAAGITDDIVNALSRFRWFSVIGRQSSARFKASTTGVKEIERELNVQYLVTGSIRRSGDQVRLTAQLSDAGTSHQLWAGRYDVELSDSFAVQDRIAEQVAGAIEPELLRSESSIAAKRRHAGDVNVSALVNQGTWFFHQVSFTTHVRARELFRRATELDPESPEANGWLARVDAGMVAYGWSEDVEGDLVEGVTAALKAVHLDEQNPYTHYGLAITSVYAGKLEQGMRAAERALELSPCFALGHLVLGLAKLFAGAAIAAVAPLERGLLLSASDPQSFVWYNALALAHALSGDLTKGRDSALKALKVRPAWRPTLEILVFCHVRLGNIPAARAYFEQITRLEKSAGDAFEPMKRINLGWAADFAEALRLVAASTERSMR